MQFLPPVFQGFLTCMDIFYIALAVSVFVCCLGERLGWGGGKE